MSAYILAHATIVDPNGYAAYTKVSQGSLSGLAGTSFLAAEEVYYSTDY